MKLRVVFGLILFSIVAIPVVLVSVRTLGFFNFDVWLIAGFLVVSTAYWLNRRKEGEESYDDDHAKNLERLKVGKEKDWLEMKERKWICQRCGRSISDYNECHWCGAKLEIRSQSQA